MFVLFSSINAESLSIMKIAEFIYEAVMSSSDSVQFCMTIFLEHLQFIFTLFEIKSTSPNSYLKYNFNHTVCKSKFRLHIKSNYTHKLTHTVLALIANTFSSEDI